MIVMELEIAILDFDNLSEEKINGIVDGLKESKDFFCHLLNGEYEEALSLDCVKTLLDSGDNTTDLTSLIQERVQKFLQDGNSESQLLVLGVASACLQIFLQHNWTGPFTSQSPVEHLPAGIANRKNLKNEIEDALTMDSETPYALARHPVFLFIARVLLLDCRDLLRDCQTSSWWLIRTLCIQQALLDERSPSLKATIEQLIEEVSKVEELMTARQFRVCAIQFHLEASHTLHYYYNARAGREHMSRAEELVGLDIQLIGAMGKRTRFQKKELSQLVLQVHRKEEEVQVSGAGEGEQTLALSKDKKQLPHNLPLDDETVLENIKLSDDIEASTLTPVEQATVLGLCHQHRKLVEGQGHIVREESMAYLEYVLASPQSWCVQSLALLRRSQWEKDSPRRVQRSLQQFEELVNQCSRPSPPAAHRLPLVHAVNLPPHWNVQGELAAYLCEMGAMAAALEVYERLQMWEDVIKCYAQMGRREKAEVLIREQLVLKETPALYCYLGDVTEEPAHYEKAWELSNSRSARAQKSLARYFLAKNEFERSLDHFEKSVTVNPLQIDAWFSYGCAAIACANYNTAARAFRRCVNLDNDNYEAWNNLATAYIRDNQKGRAYATLMEAMKWEYENGRVWENLMLVATDIGEFSQAMICYHRLIDLKHKWTDPQVVAIWVRAVTENLPDATGADSKPLRPKLQELMGRITSTVTTDADLWKCYAELLMKNPDATQTDQERALQYLQKSHRCATQAINWEREVDACKKVALLSVSIAKVYLQYGSEMEDGSKACQMLTSARLMLKGVSAKITQKHLDPVSESLPEELVESSSELEDHLNKITDLIKEKREQSS